MKKNSINKRIKVKADLNQNSEQSEENSNEKEKENEITHENDSTTYNTYRCPNCFSIPKNEPFRSSVVLVSLVILLFML